MGLTRCYKTEVFLHLYRNISWFKKVRNLLPNRIEFVDIRGVVVVLV